MQVVKDDMKKMNRVNVIVPSVFVRFTDGKSVCSVNAETVSEALMHVVNEHPNLKPQLLDENNRLLAYLQVFVNEDNIRDLHHLETKLHNRDEVLIIPALAGG